MQRLPQEKIKPILPPRVDKAKEWLAYCKRIEEKRAPRKEPPKIKREQA